jgi:hypothetical protein
MQGGIALGMLVDRLRGIELLEAPEPRGFAFRKPEALHRSWEV